MPRALRHLSGAEKDAAIKKGRLGGLLRMRQKIGRANSSKRKRFAFPGKSLRHIQVGA